jgi:hypothetical protein
MNGNNEQQFRKMNYKGALKLTNDKIYSSLENTKLQRTIKYSSWEGKPGWVKITNSTERVPVKQNKDSVSIIEKEYISLEGFVKLQERRMAEYDSDRWEGAFRELYPIYPPYPEEEYEEKEEWLDGQYFSDSDNYLSEQEY